jgi:hypothetical protein
VRGTENLKIILKKRKKVREGERDREFLKITKTKKKGEGE